MACNLLPGDRLVTCRLPAPENGLRPRYLTEESLWLIGLYLAEGSRSDDTIQLGLNADEAPWLPRIKDAAASLGATMTYTLSGNRLAVRLYGRVLVAALDEYIGGKTSLDIHLRRPAWNLSDADLKILISGYLDGDGRAEKSRVRLGFCRNYALERDLRTAAARLGATLTLTPGMAEYQHGAKPSFRGEWRWAKSGHHNEKNRGEIVKIQRGRAREFWDIEVADAPNLFALASGVLTHNCKNNPMPEAVQDRPTSSHEHIFMLTKSERYYFDGHAVKEVAVSDHPSGNGYKRDEQLSRGGRGQREGWTDVGGGRNIRNVWNINSQPYKGSHFATFPQEIPRLCVSASTSECGGCAACGAPFRRILEKGEPDVERQRRSGGDASGQYAGQSTKDHDAAGVQNASDVKRRILAGMVAKRTIAWEPTCRCPDAWPVPQTVLDPFSGAGTTAMVANRLGRGRDRYRA